MPDFFDQHKTDKKQGGSHREKQAPLFKYWLDRTMLHQSNLESFDFLRG